MFEDRLKTISDRIGGVLALSLISRDGIPVESVQEDEEVDLEVLSAELITQVQVISDDQRDLDVGTVRHFAITTDVMTVMLTAMTDEYFLLLVLGDPSRHGRARFELQRARLVFEDDLTV